MYESEKYRSEFGRTESFDSLVRQRLSSVAPETLADYLSNNRDPHLLTGISDLGIPHVLVTEGDLTFQDSRVDRGWTGFYQKYPESSGIVFFSAVGFNRSHDQAFVYTGRQCGGLCGAGEYVLLKKENGVWAIEQRMDLWVS